MQVLYISPSTPIINTAMDEAGTHKENNFKEEICHTPQNARWQLVKSVTAFIVMIALMYLSGIHQLLFYQQTPEDIHQEPIAGTLDASSITLPLNVFILINNESLGSERSEENARNLIENASNIWQQANIELVAGTVATVTATDRQIADFLRSPRSLTNTLNTYDETAINVFFVSSLRGINGVAFSDANTIVVADYTSVYDFRTLAHEVGHIVGLPHVERDRNRLMYRGANGLQLSLQEIMDARTATSRFAIEQDHELGHTKPEKQ